MDYWSFYFSLIIINIINSIAFSNSEKLKYCVVESAHTSKRIHKFCPPLAISKESKVECVVAHDRYECMRFIASSMADFSVFEPEDLLVAAAHPEYSLLVTSEIREFKQHVDSYKMVVIVQDNIKGLGYLRKKRFCHPGFYLDEEWINLFSLFFENYIIPRDCDEKKSILENRLTRLSNFFESSCIPGAWTSDPVKDSYLKKKYRNLCESCDSPFSCSTEDKYYGRQGAMLCLTENAGDFAYVRLADAMEYFKVENVNISNYNLLCIDGTIRPVDTSSPCVWITRPWPVVVSQRSKAERVTSVLNKFWSESTSYTPLKWQTQLLELIRAYNTVPISVDVPRIPEDYLGDFPGFLSASKRTNCPHLKHVNWCVTSSIENQKCQWVRDASSAYGIEPKIDCILKNSLRSCIDAVNDQFVDIVVVRPEDLMEAKKSNLKSIIHAVPRKATETNRIAAIVRQDSKYKTLKDLKGSRACFTGYRSIGWNTFMDAIENITDISAECKDKSAATWFFGAACVPDLANTGRDKNLYSLCDSGSAISTDDTNVFNCLTSGVSDVIFANLKIAEKLVLDNTSNFYEFKYKTLCNDKVASDVRSSCILSWFAFAEIFVHENITSLRSEDIYSMFLQVDQLFGKNFKGQTPALSLYGDFDSKENILFPAETYRLQYRDKKFDLNRNYDDIIEKLSTKPLCDSASLERFSHVISLCLIFCLLVVT